MVLGYQGLELGMRRVGFRNWGMREVEFMALPVKIRNGNGSDNCSYHKLISSFF